MSQRISIDGTDNLSDDQAQAIARVLIDGVRKKRARQVDPINSTGNGSCRQSIRTTELDDDRINDPVKGFTDPPGGHQ